MAPFEWESFLELAKELKNGDEAKKRTAVSRSYFALYGFALRHAVGFLKFTPSQKAEDHKELRTHLKKQKNPNYQKVADYLDITRMWRNDCDYEDEVSNLDKLVENSIKYAEKGIETLINSLK